MAGNSQRRGAMRKPGSKKGQVKGTGGQQRKGLKGKGPTPPAQERKGHSASRRAASNARRTEESKAAPRRSGGSTRRAKGGSEVVAGRNAVVEALRANIPANALVVGVRIDSDDRVKEAIALATEQRIALLEAPRAELDRITDGAVHQGIALQVPAYDYAHPDDLLDRATEAGESAFVVALDGVTDPRNLGAIVRSAGAFGAHGVVVPERRSARMTATAWKASAGAAARVPVAHATNLTRVLESYKSSGLMVVGLAADGDSSVGELDLGDDPVVVVVGSEGKGMARLVAQTCDVVVSIPMADETESLNASVAASIVLHEIARGRAG